MAIEGTYPEPWPEGFLDEVRAEVGPFLGGRHGARELLGVLDRLNGIIRSRALAFELGPHVHATLMPAGRATQIAIVDGRDRPSILL